MGDSSSSSSGLPERHTLRSKLRSVENHVAALVKLMEKKGNMKCFDLYEKKVAEMHTLREKCAKLPGPPLTPAPSTPTFKRKAPSSISPFVQSKKRKQGSESEEIDKKIRAARNHITSLEKLSKRPGKGHLQVVISARQSEIKALQLARSEANRRRALAIRLEKSQKKGAAARTGNSNPKTNVNVSKIEIGAGGSRFVSPKSVAISPSSSSSPEGGVSALIDMTQPSREVNRELFVNSQASTSSSAASQESFFVS